MKKCFIVLVAILMMGYVLDASAQRHRHHQSVTVNVDNDSSAVGITACSDTTDTDSAAVDTAQYNYSIDDADGGSGAFKDLCLSMAHNGGGIAVLFSLLGIAILLAPVLLIAVILYFVFRSRNQKYKLAERAISEGKPIPQELLRVDKQSYEYLWTRGIKNAALGIGLVCLFWILGAEELIGIGLLVFFLGVGKMVIAKTTRRKSKTRVDGDNDKENFDDGDTPEDNEKATDKDGADGGSFNEDKTVKDSTSNNQ